MNAPPRSSVAPAALAISAASRVCWADSTAHGPAMKVKVSGPIGTSWPGRPTWTVERSGWCWRLTSLKGSEIRWTSWTPGMLRRLRPWKDSMSPTRPMIVRTTPRLTKAWPPVSSTRSVTVAICSSVAPGAITTTMVRG